MPEPRVSVANEELFTVRDAMRGLNRIVDEIAAGTIEKAVLMRRGKMVCVVLPLGEMVGRRSTEG